MNQILVSAYKLEIPLKIKFSHTSAERTKSESIWIQASRGPFIGYGEGCPRIYVTGESLKEASQITMSWMDKITQKVVDLNSLLAFVETNKEFIDDNPSVWCAFELAFLDLFAKEASISIESLLGISKSKNHFKFSAVLGQKNVEGLKKNLRKYSRLGFKDFKLKIFGNPDIDNENLNLVSQYFYRQNISWIQKILFFNSLPNQLRIDANNAWANRYEECVSFVKQHSKIIFAIEEPLASKDFNKLFQLGVETSTKIILDESLTKIEDLDKLDVSQKIWIANLRISKLGGIIRTLKVLKKCESLGIPVIIGAQVGETSVLTRAALVVARVAKNLLAQEGAFGDRLLEIDPVTPQLKFGWKGLLKTNNKSENLKIIKKSLQKYSTPIGTEAV